MERILWLWGTSIWGLFNTCKKKLENNVTTIDSVSTDDDIGQEIITAGHHNDSVHDHTINDHKEKLIKILKKHGIDDKDNIYNALQILCIYREHECRMGKRRLDNANLILINDRQNILHTITVKTVQPYVRLYGKSRCESKATKNTTISLNVFVKKKNINYFNINVSKLNIFKANRNTDNAITRHFVSIPFAGYVQNTYNLQLPQCFYNIIQSYLSEDGTDSGGNCILYQNFEQTIAIAAENKSENDRKQQDYDYQTRTVNIIDDTGYDVSLTIELNVQSIQESKKIAFYKYMKPIIDSFNEKIEMYLRDNKFYQISFKTVDEIENLNRQISIEGGTASDYGTANFKCEFSGFNNLNIKTIGNDTNCVIKSQSFKIKLENNRYWVESRLRLCSAVMVNDDNIIDIDMFWNWISQQPSQLDFEMKTTEFSDEIQLD